MALFQKKIGPVFLKEDSDAIKFIEKMQELEKKTTDANLKADIQKRIKLAAYGESGEKNISFELKNSGMDMYILHDIYLEFGDLSAQIDYLVVTRKLNFVIESKNLIGNIEIDNQGNFIRTYELFGKKIKEGIYSPITQNRRHLEVLKNVRKEAKGNILFKMAFEHYFDENYKSLVVLANSKTYLNAKYAKKEVKDQVIRADQIIQRIKEMNAKCREAECSDKDMLEVAKFFLNANKCERSDYAKAYEEMVEQVAASEQKGAEIKRIEQTIAVPVKVASKPVLVDSGENSNIEKKCPKCGSKMVLRTATKGTNAGNKFYGCTGFPKCRYIENI